MTEMNRQYLVAIQHIHERLCKLEVATMKTSRLATPGGHETESEQRKLFNKLVELTKEEDRAKFKDTFWELKHDIIFSDTYNIWEDIDLDTNGDKFLDEYVEHKGESAQRKLFHVLLKYVPRHEQSTFKLLFWELYRAIVKLYKEKYAEDNNVGYEHFMDESDDEDDSSQSD